MIVEPFHLYDCCPENDGATAILVTTPDRAADLGARAVPILACAQGLGPMYGLHTFQQRWFGQMFYRQVGATLWERTGLRPADWTIAGPTGGCR